MRVFCAAFALFVCIGGATSAAAERSEEFETSLEPAADFEPPIVPASRDCASGFGVPVWRDPTMRPIGVVCVAASPNRD
jgi:hypothetical protein